MAPSALRAGRWVAREGENGPEGGEWEGERPEGRQPAAEMRHEGRGGEKGGMRVGVRGDGWCRGRG